MIIDDYMNLDAFAKTNAMENISLLVGMYRFLNTKDKSKYWNLIRGSTIFKDEEILVLADEVLNGR